jgi:CHAT domain-containing protein
MNLPPLPEARKEAEKVFSLIPRSILLEGQNATLPRVRAALRSAQLFHFAGHGYGGEGGGLILTGTAGGAAMLRAADIQNLDLSRCPLAVLSGCSTGSGELRGPGDPRSLVRAFLRAGVREVVASYWDLSSPGTSKLMQEFYRALLDRKPAAESLRQARAALRSGGIYTHPYYWAGLEVFQ